MYRDEARAYHNLDHVAQCLREFDSLRPLAENPHAVELAIWFHDAVYDSRAKDNEEQSAQLAAASLAKMGLAGELPRAVQALILLTRHDRAPATADERIIIDVDLSILGQPPDVFDRYESGVREEYAWLADDEFWPKRRDFLKTFLARERIYHTEPCARKYERRARENLQRSIRGFRGG